MRILTLASLFAIGCSNSDPHWALDTMYVEPTESGVQGSQTWQVYRKAWKRKFKARHYLCSVLVTFDGPASTADCPGCLMAASPIVSVADSDCPENVTSDPTFLSLRRIGIGPLTEGGPHLTQSSVGFVDYGLGWEVHGWAYPEALDHGFPTDATTWDGTEVFAMAPAFVWDLSTATPESLNDDPSDVPPVE